MLLVVNAAQMAMPKIQVPETVKYLQTMRFMPRHLREGNHITLGTHDASELCQYSEMHLS